MALPRGIGESNILNEPVNLRGFSCLSFQAFKWKLELARNKLEDHCLDVQIPESVKKHITFYRLHCTYFLLLAILGTCLFFAAHRSNTGERRFSMVDSIFNMVSVVTETGLTSVRLADLSLFDQMLLLILMTLGSPVFTSLLPLYVRRFHFYVNHRRFIKDLRKQMDSSVSNGKVQAAPKFVVSNPEGEDQTEECQDLDGRQLPSIPLFFCSPEHPTSNQRVQSGHVQVAARETETFSLTMDIVRAFKPVSETDILGGKKDQVVSSQKKDYPQDDTRFKSWQGVPPSPYNIMKTIEHRGLVALCWIVPIYLFVCQLATFLLILLVFSGSPDIMNILKNRGLSAVFFSFFNSVSAFTNSGVLLDDGSLAYFKSQHVILLVYTMTSLLGNLLYPPCIRLIIWILHRFSPKSRKPVYSYLLHHPRRCFTHLFPHKQSVWLCLTVIGFTVFQIIVFCSLDWHSEVMAGLGTWSKIVDGIFQSVSVRTSGATVVDIRQLDSAVLVLYLFMMFIAAYPVALLRQNSTEYDQANLAIYDKSWEEKLTDNSLTFQSRKLLGQDSVYLFATLFIICLTERQNIQEDPLNYSIFNIIFEIVSAYGGVGMSMGYNCSLRVADNNNDQLSPCTDVPYSLSGKWSPTGRLILAVAMFMGRHRGLPDDIDSAIKLPNALDNPPTQSIRSRSSPWSVRRSFTPSPTIPPAATPSMFDTKSPDESFRASLHNEC